MLIGLLNPQWPSSASSVEFSEIFAAWEDQIHKYEQDAGAELSDDIKVAVVTKHAPDKIREVLRAASHHIDGDYKAMRRTLEHYLRSGVDYDSYGVAQGSNQQQGPVPMDVGAIGKGKEFGKDKGKGKGKDFGKDKGKFRSKGGKDRGKGKQHENGKGSSEISGGKPPAQ
eukprot:5462497-Amphidinium_carterae.1